MNTKLLEEIQTLKKKRNAVILAHYYVNEEVQAIADYVGDSYYLSKVATNTDADVLVFCGVGFMGESAKILNPEKTVLLPDPHASCPMAEMANPEKIEEIRRKFKDLAVVCYINSTAEIKAHCDVCVTSANAEKIIRALPNQNIYFVPDENLARHIALQVPEKHFIFNNGYCHVHKNITAESVLAAKKDHPNAPVLMHPECTPKALALADYIGSTSGILKYATENPSHEFLIATETGIFYQLQRSNPDKTFYPILKEQICPDMKKITLEKIKHVLLTNENAVTIPDTLRIQSGRPLARMLELAK